MTALDPAVGALLVQTRLAAACGALGVPGVPLGTALRTVGERRIGPVRFGSEAALDRLTVVVVTPPYIAEDVLDALGQPPVSEWLDGLAPSEVELRVTVTTTGEVTTGLSVEVDRSAAHAVDLLGRLGVSSRTREGLADGIAALGLSRVGRLGFGDGRVSLTLGQVLTDAGLVATADRVGAASRLVGSAPQATWQRAMLLALGPGRTAAPVTLVAGATGLVEVGVGYTAVAAETVLRTVLALVPQDRSGAVLGALAAAADGPDRWAVALVAREVEPPVVRFVVGAGSGWVRECRMNDHS